MYNPNQARDPKGTNTGGQWTAAGSSNAIKQAASDVMSEQARYVKQLADQKKRQTEAMTQPEYTYFFNYEFPMGTGGTVGNNRITIAAGSKDEALKMAQQQLPAASNFKYTGAVATKDWRPNPVYDPEAEKRSAHMLDFYDSKVSTPPGTRRSKKDDWAFENM